jgi:hypothetical protein
LEIKNQKLVGKKREFRMKILTQIQHLKASLRFLRRNLGLTHLLKRQQLVRFTFLQIKPIKIYRIGLSICQHWNEMQRLGYSRMLCGGVGQG